MLQLCLLAVLLIQAQAELRCGEEIITEVIEDYDQILGNWTYVMHWDKLEDDKGEKYPIDHYECATVDISEADEYDVINKQNSCKSNDDDYFDYANAKYKLVAPELNLYDTLIAVGSDKSMMEICGIIAGLEVRKVSDDYILMINYENGYIVELLARRIPSREELECFVDNIDVVFGLDGATSCYA